MLINQVAQNTNQDGNQDHHALAPLSHLSIPNHTKPKWVDSALNTEWPLLIPTTFHNPNIHHRRTPLKLWRTTWSLILMLLWTTWRNIWMDEHSNYDAANWLSSWFLVTTVLQFTCFLHRSGCVCGCSAASSWSLNGYMSCGCGTGKFNSLFCL